ncbi:DUF2634 domain-containing protein [Bacillus sp. JJ722]|uniref:DUF2634 domain-containing protein n=1 Tax=Bacillus sp. JJ722 TaxID=3122973 RepID=UPI002FFE2B65
MALTPDNVTELLDDYLAEEEEGQAIEPSKTYRINFDGTNRLTGMVDDLDAVKQFSRKALITSRSHFLIYTDDYGCELEDLIGQDVTDAFLESEVPRMVREALIYDDRIIEVNNIRLRREGDALFVALTVISIFGDYTQEVRL